MKSGILGSLEKKRLQLFSVGSENYLQSLTGVAKALSGNKVCYVSLNKTYPAVEDWLQKNGCNSKNFVFVDAISRQFRKTGTDTKRCFFAGSPSALTELSIAISKALPKSEILLLDSISSLSIYNKEKPIELFISSLSNRLRESNKKAVFFILNDDKLINPCSLFVDEVVKK